jgi:hypothetical protein
MGHVLLAVGGTLTATAAEYFYNFDPPNGDPALAGLILVGVSAANCWHTNNGASGLINDGFLEINPPANFQNLGIVFPREYYTNADGSLLELPLNGFFIEGDVRIGNAIGNNGQPADGLSISYAELNDPVLYWANQGLYRGWAGGDSDVEAAEPWTFDYVHGFGAMDPTICGGVDAENGTKTGISVQFDTWQGNTIIDDHGLPADDNVGWRVHYKGKMLKRVIAQPPSGSLGPQSSDGENDLNGLAVCPAFDQGFDQDPLCTAAVCADTNTLQTGPYNSIYNGSPDDLCWTHFSIELTAGVPPELTVIFKGRPVVDHLVLTNYIPFIGQFVLGGRTASANENYDLDNLHIVTYSAFQAVFKGISSASSFINDFTLTMANTGPAKVTAVSSVTLDGFDITANTKITIDDPLSTATFQQPDNFTPGIHFTSITFRDSSGHEQTCSTGFRVLPWVVLPASLAVPVADTSFANQGFRIQAHQTLQNEPDRLYWADEELIGLHGTNVIDFSAVNGYDAASGEIVWQNPFSLHISPNGNADQTDFSSLGIAGTYANSSAPYNNFALACDTYLYFRTAGTYLMGASSDDGLRVTFAANSHDVLGTQVPGMLADTSRAIGPDQNLGALVVSAAGYYGFRLLYENGSGDAGVGWYFRATPATNGDTLIDDLLNYPDTAITAYQLSSAAPPYASFAEPPLNDDQVAPDEDFKWQLTDAATIVDSRSVVLKLNGVTQAPSVSNSGGLTTISLPHVPGQPHPSGNNVVDLAFKDSAGKNYAYNYSFVVPGPPAIIIGPQGGSWAITYTGTLCSSATVDGTYSPVPGASSPYSIPTGSAPNLFYRSRQ